MERFGGRSETSVQPHRERRAVIDLEDDGREAVIMRLRLADNFADSRRIGRFDAATEREGEQLFRELADE